MLGFADRTKETSTSTGTGSLQLGGAVSGFKTFVDGIGAGITCPYLIDDGLGNWELTWGVPSSGTPDTLSRGALINSSTGSRIDFGAGSKTIAVVTMAELSLQPTPSAALIETDIASATTTDLGAITTFRAHITGTTTITGFGDQPNSLRIVRFEDALALTHDATSLILLDGVTRFTSARDIGIYVSDEDGNWREISYSCSGGNRRRLLGDTTFYVATTGNDVTGNGTIGKPWATISFAIAYVQNHYDVNGYNLTFQIADGTYNDSAAFNLIFTGQNKFLNIQGNPASDSAVEIHSTTANPAIICNNGSAVNVQHLKLSAVTAAGMLAASGGSISFKNVVFGDTGDAQIRTLQGGIAVCATAYSVDGSSGAAHILAQQGGMVKIDGSVVSIPSSQSFPIFAHSAQLGIITASGTSFVVGGTVTAQRYNSRVGAIIDTGGTGSASFFPGSSAGATSSGGQYV